MNGISFFNTIILFTLLFILLPITQKRINIMFKIIISILFTFIINSLIIFVFSFANIACTLLLRNIIFIFFSVVELIIIRKKGIQIFEFKFRDFIVLLFVIFITLLLSKYRFKDDMDLYFETTDPAVHYISALRFSETNELSEKREEKDLFYPESENSTMFLSYTTLGTIFQIEKELNCNQFCFVQTFLIFEIIVLGLTGFLVYLIICRNQKKMSFINIIIMFAVLILLMSGYPLNNLIFGYHYLGISILYGLIVLMLTEKLIKEKSILLVIITSLFAFSIFTLYYMFVPIFYGACGIYILYKWFILKEISAKKTIILIVSTLVIPFIIGILYYFVRNCFIDVSGPTGVNVFKLEGYIYRNLIGNFVLLFIIIITKIISDIKYKNITLSCLCFIFTIIFMLILFIPFYKGTIASYYFYKLHYVLWVFSFIILGESLITKENNIELITKVVTILLFILFVAQIKDVDERLYEKNPLINPYGFVTGLTNVYNFNETRMNVNNSEPIYTHKDLKNIIRLSEKYSSKMKNSVVIFNAGLMQKLWFYDFSRINPNGEKEYLFSFYEDNLSMEEINKNKNIQYVICYIDDCEELTNKNYDIIYKNESFQIFERK